MSQNIPLQADLMTPAEAKSWQQWADKSPELVRAMAETLNKVKADFRPYKIGGIAVGALLSGATLTKYVPGKWKWVSGAAAATSLAAGALAGTICSAADSNQQLLNYADVLEKDPKLRQVLAHFLSTSVQAEHIQKAGIGEAVLQKALEFGEQTHYLQSPGQQREAMSR